jgi:hypothetical protein
MAATARPGGGAGFDGAPKGSFANIARHATGAFDKKAAVKL